MVITSKIHPDEFSRGYRGRLQILNQYSSAKRFMAALREEMHPQGAPLDKCPDAVTLDLAAGMDLEQFVRSHSLIPLFRMVTPKDTGVIHGDPARLDIIKHYGTLKWDHVNPRVCLECIKEDLAFWRYTYWRRSHQLPGICWCSKHGSQLAISSMGSNAFDELPSLDMDVHFEFTPRVFKQISECPAIQHYADILFAFLDSKQPIAPIHANYLVSQQIKLHPIRNSKSGERRTFADRVLEEFPEHWVQALYPSIAKRLKGESFSPIDGLSCSSVSNHTFALGLAILFESSDEAINYWVSKPDDLPKSRKTFRKFGWDYWNSKEMYDLYVKHFGNIISISEELDIAPDIVRENLMAAGLPALGKLGMESTGRAILDYHGGMSLKEACEKNDATQEVVDKLLRSGISKVASAIKQYVQPKMRKNAKARSDKVSLVYDERSLKRGQVSTASTNS